MIEKSKFLGFQVSTKGITDFEDYMERAEDAAKLAAVHALNKGADFAVERGTEEIMDQVNFPRRYVEQKFFRLNKASKTHLQTGMYARQRGTSLSRFDPLKASGGVSVMVKKRRRLVKRAFPIRLRSGNRAVSTDNFNRGVAIRLKKGETIKGKKVQFSRKDPGLYLLYGPSVSQVFNTVRDTINDDVSNMIDAEFRNEFERLTG